MNKTRFSGKRTPQKQPGFGEPPRFVFWGDHCTLSRQALVVLVKSSLLLHYPCHLQGISVQARPHQARPYSPPWVPPARAAEPFWARRQHGLCLPSGMLYFSAQKGGMWGKVYLVRRPACAVRWCFCWWRCHPRWLATNEGASLLGKVVGQASAWPRKTIFCAVGTCSGQPSPTYCRVELLAEISSSGHLLMFLVQVASCLEDTLGWQCNGTNPAEQTGSSTRYPTPHQPEAPREPLLFVHAWPTCFAK